MSGILDSKKRIIDTIVTAEGKKQLARGGLRAAFYSFTDSGAVYNESTIISASHTTSASLLGISASQIPTLDATHRFVLESTSLPQDTISFIADDSGKLNGIQAINSEKYVLRSGEIYSGSVEHQRVLITGSLFASLSKEIMSGSLNSFKNQMILKSPDPIDDKERQFIVGPDQLEFKITKTTPFDKNEITNLNVEYAESFFQDERLSNLANYNFLPPVNKTRPGASKRTSLGTYVNLGQEALTDFSKLEREFTTKETKTIRFTETSRQNNVFCQMFELSDGKMVKLDVIDFGYFQSEDGSNLKHVFFAGKVFIDDYGNPTYVNIFTIIFED